MWLDFGTALLLQSSKYKFLFLTVKHSCWGTAQIQPPAADFPVLCKQCQRGRADTSRKWRLNPGEERAFSRAGLDIAWAFLGVCQEISSWHCCWPEEYKITIFQSRILPSRCSVFSCWMKYQKRTKIIPYSELQARVRGSQAVSESRRNTVAHILYIVILSTDE